jgi:hypothetical protein
MRCFLKILRGFLFGINLLVRKRAFSYSKMEVSGRKTEKGIWRIEISILENRLSIFVIEMAIWRHKLSINFNLFSISEIESSVFVIAFGMKKRQKKCPDEFLCIKLSGQLVLSNV